MLTLDAIVGAATANSYATLAEANAYFEARRHTDNWINLGATEKTAVLLWATKLLDSRVSWNGVKAAQTQALAWPRADVENQDASYLGTTVYLSATTIPLFVKDAQCEYALILAGEDITLDPDMVGLSSVKVGDLAITAHQYTQRASVPRAVRELVSGYGKVNCAGGMGTVKLTRT